MNKREVDARVQLAVENLQAGRTTEDDNGIEFKESWPEPTLQKVRQLGGAANTLRGDPLIYVVGVEDKTGRIVTPERREPQDWYAGFRKRFDQVPPELLWGQAVYIGNPAQSVFALVFDTSEFPYVVNDANRRDVPMRVVSGTESAHRNQLIRMFNPVLRPPRFTITEMTVRAIDEDRPRIKKGVNPLEYTRHVSLGLSITAKVLVEPMAREPQVMPVRDLKGRLRFNEYEVRPEIAVKHLGDTDLQRAMANPAPEPAPPRYGVYARENHVVATAPGEFTIYANATYGEFSRERAEMVEWLTVEDTINFDMAIRVLGVDNVSRTTAPLDRTSGNRETREEMPPLGERIVRRLGTWRLTQRYEDPWFADDPL